MTATPTPVTSTLRTAWRLSIAIVLLMVVASAAGLWVPGLYRDPGSVTAMLRAYDLITLLVVAPTLTAALAATRRGSVRAQLVWLGALAHAVYNYAIYVFGTAFNAVFLIHVALFSLSIFALVLALSSVDVPAIARRFSARTPVRWISGLLAFLAVGLGGMWMFYSMRFAVTGAFPEESLLVLPAASIHLAYVLDLALLVPGYALASALLWRRAAWGYVLASILLISGAIVQLGYMTALVFQANAQVPGATAFDPQEPFFAAAFLVGSLVMLTNLKSATD